jgi:hypothetical protein
MRECFDSECLSRSGNPFDQRVTLGQKSDNDLLERFVLTDNGLTKLVKDVGNC